MDSFNLDILSNRFGAALARRIVDHDSESDKFDEQHRLLLLVVDHPELLKFQQSLEIGGKDVGDLFLDVMNRAPRELTEQMESTQRLFWRFGKMEHSLLRRSIPAEKDVEKIPYRVSRVSVEGVYRRLASESDLVVMKTGDDIVPRIIDCLPKVKKLPHFLYGVADMENGYVALRIPSTPHYSESVDECNWIRRYVNGAFAYSFPALSGFSVYAGDKAGVFRVYMEEDLSPVFDLFEPFATHVEIDCDDDVASEVTFVSSTRRDNAPLLYKFNKGYANMWPGIPESAEELWRVETKVPENHDKDSTFSQMLLHGVRLQSRSAFLDEIALRSTDVFVQGASNLYRIDPKGPPFIWNHLPKNEVRAGMPVGFLATGPAAQSMVSAMWTHVMNPVPLLMK